MRFAMLTALIFAYVGRAFADTSACFKNVPRINQLWQASMPKTSRTLHSVSSFCRDISNRQIDRTSKTPTVDRRDFSGFKFIINEQSSDLKNRYQKEIESIKAEPLTAKRIEKSYRLVTKAFGDFNFTFFEKRLANLHLDNPNALRSALLAVTLSESKNKQSEFGLQLLTFIDEKLEIEQTFVRVHIQKDDVTFDLDPSINGLTYVALLPRHLKLDQKSFVEFFNECLSIIQCQAWETEP